MHTLNHSIKSLLSILQQGDNTRQNYCLVVRHPSKTKMLWKSGLQLLNLLLRLRFCINYLMLLVWGQHVPKSNYKFKRGFSTSNFCLKIKFMIPKVVHKSLCKVHREDLTVEVTLASQLEQTEFMPHNVD